MDRKTVTTVARSMGAKLVGRDHKTAWYLFPNADTLLAFREQIPYLTLWGCGAEWDGEILIVYFDQIEQGVTTP